LRTRMPHLRHYVAGDAPCCLPKRPRPRCQRLAPFDAMTVFPLLWSARIVACRRRSRPRSGTGHPLSARRIRLGWRHPPAPGADDLERTDVCWLTLEATG
jgi:hypothetical protein